jgi:SAM-dependent methyltransferase
MAAIVSTLEDGIPVPPAALAAYVGDRYHDDPVFSYLNAGRAIRAAIEQRLPGDWILDGKTVLDFGSGSGRVLRQFLPEARAGIAAFHGADIHGPSIDWAREHLSPPLSFVQSTDLPPLPFDDGTFDLIWATSVFSHLTDSWSAWLLELHRLLRPDGILLATFMSDGYARILTGDEMNQDEVGMNVLGYGAPWEAGGPMVLHSEWWIRAHWGRAFDFESLEVGGFLPVGEDAGQGVAVMRRKDVALAATDLEALEPNEPREVIALQRSLDQVKWERADLNRRHDEYSMAYHALSDEHKQLRSAHDRALETEREATGQLLRQSQHPVRASAGYMVRAVRAMGSRVRDRLAGHRRPRSR